MDAHHESDPTLQTAYRLLAQTAPDLARRWRKLARAPRYRLLLDPDERFSCVLILLPVREPRPGESAGERLLRTIFGNDTCVLAVERGTRILKDLGRDDREGRERLLRAARRGAAEALRYWSAWRAGADGQAGRGSLALLARGSPFSLLAGSHYRRSEALIQEALDRHPALHEPLLGQIERSAPPSRSARSAIYAGPGPICSNTSTGGRCAMPGG